MSHSQIPGRQRVLLIADTLYLNQTAIFAELALYLSLLNQGFQVLCLLPEDLFSRGYELQPEPPELSYHWILLKLKLPFFWGQKFISGMPETVSPSVSELSELLSPLQPPLSGEILTRQANDLRRFYHCLDRLNRDFEPEQVIVYGGNSPISGLALAFFRQGQIPIWSYALPRPQQICFFENQSQATWRSRSVELALARWDAVPLRAHQLESLKQAWLADFSALKPLFQRTAADKGAPGLIFWQCQADAEKQLQWLRGCLSEKAHTLPQAWPQTWWVIVPEGESSPDFSAQLLLAELQDLPFQFLELGLQQWLNETPDFASIALIYHSEMALACVALGLQVFQGPASPWVLEPDLSAEDLNRLAWRRGFCLRLRMPIPIEPLEILEPEDCQLSAKSWYALKPGLHPGFAQIAKALRGRFFPFPQPERYDLLRSDAEEQSWHDPGTELCFPAPGPAWCLTESSVAVPHTPLPARLTCSTQTAAQQGQKPKISVVVPCYNFAAFVEEAAQSILNQTFLNWEMILVNDGSTDQTAQICRELIAGFPDRAIWLLDQPNAGQPAITINNGIERACGEYIQVLSGDDWLSPNFLASSAQILDNYPNLSIAYGYQQNFGKDTEFHPASSEYRLSNLTFYNFIGSASLFRKTAWAAVKGIQTDVIGYEDWDFWIACGKNVHFGKSNPEAIFYYRTHFTESLLARQSKKDRQLKSQIILHHPSLYTESQRQWALAAQADPEGQNDPANKFAVMPHFKEPLPLYLQILDRHYQTFALSPQRHDIWESIVAMFINTRQREYVLAYRLSPHAEEALQPIQQGQDL
ncbi:MAG: glycosyltransferase family 2 protein, partial [Candidatus Sericytochromatia bacterium]